MPRKNQLRPVLILKLNMFSVGGLILTAIVALVVLGPKQLPAAAYQFGLIMRKLKQLLQPLRHAAAEQTKQAELTYNQQRAAAAEQQSAPSPHE